jgi:hypothetical protein
MCRTEIEIAKIHIVDNFDPNKSKARLEIDREALKRKMSQIDDIY